MVRLVTSLVVMVVVEFIGVVIEMVVLVMSLMVMVVVMIITTSTTTLAAVHCAASTGLAMTSPQQRLLLTPPNRHTVSPCPIPHPSHSPLILTPPASPTHPVTPAQSPLIEFCLRDLLSIFSPSVHVSAC
ncbi:hypothetical protein E2C01_099410 [Portunus trituberculatus]|uniref:Uncharacterized protein n=1 Tax=Portunus trituberculatus TaxID=210409 RepID=A0A5B7KEV2_PORTR|nr:hypothetical protein [Portunus trituberculatus]